MKPELIGRLTETRVSVRSAAFEVIHDTEHLWQEVLDSLDYEDQKALKLRILSLQVIALPDVNDSF